MTIPSDVHQEALQLLEKADYPWNDSRKAFVEARDPQRESTASYHNRQLRIITYDQLRTNGLTGPKKKNTENGLKWLRTVLAAQGESD